MHSHIRTRAIRLFPSSVQIVTFFSLASARAFVFASASAFASAFALTSAIAFASQGNLLKNLVAEMATK